MKKGSIILLALFLIMFVVTIIFILYLTNKRYLMIAKEERENYYAINQYKAQKLSLYIVYSFAKNNGVLDVNYNVKRIYNTYFVEDEFYRSNFDPFGREIYYTLINNLIYGRIYKENESHILKLFNYHVYNLYKYDSNSYVYMPQNIYDVLKQTSLTPNEAKVIISYRDTLVEYLKDIFNIKDSDITYRCFYKNKNINNDYDSMRSYSTRDTVIIIEFKVAGVKYSLVSEFSIFTKIENIKLNHNYNSPNFSIYGNFAFKANIGNVKKILVKEGTIYNSDYSGYYEYNF